MPEITYAWLSGLVSDRAEPIVPYLKELAEEYYLAFHVTEPEQADDEDDPDSVGSEPQSVFVAEGLELPAGVVDQLRSLAKRVNVSINVLSGKGVGGG